MKLTQPLLLVATFALAFLPVHESQEARATQEFQDAEPTQLLERAAELVERGSFERALELYRELSARDLDAETTRWVDFHLADTTWRSRTSTNATDQSEIEKARTDLQALAPLNQEQKERDRVWVEVQESLGDLAWRGWNYGDWNRAWPHYQAALDWWAGQSDLDLARERYLGLVQKIVEPTRNRNDMNWVHYLHDGARILSNALKIAQDEDDVLHARFYLGAWFFHRSHDDFSIRRSREELEQVLEAGKSFDLYDDALFFLARSYQASGVLTTDEAGNPRREPDFVKAVELYRRLLREFRQGETRHYREARRYLENITGSQVEVQVDRFFLPGSSVRYRLNTRNVKNVQLSLHRVDLSEDVQLRGKEPGQWRDSVDLGRAEPVQSWSYTTRDAGQHRPLTEELALEAELPLGSYVLRAQAGGKEHRTLILVTALSVSVKTAPDQLLAWVTTALGGEPVEAAKLSLWVYYHDGSEWRHARASGVSGEDGTISFPLAHRQNSLQYFLCVDAEEGPTYSQSSVWTQRSNIERWKVYAYPDRAVYRPGETVNWKVVARAKVDSVYAPPGEGQMRWELFDQRGNKVQEGTGELNAFGSAWGSFETAATLALGTYQARFYAVNERGQSTFIGNAALFRLEEYKVPEFEVAVTLPEETTEAGIVRKKLFKPGDEVSAEIQAQYYFGGGVAGADVEVFVYQRPYYRYWPIRRDFPWLHEESSSPGRGHMWWGGPGQQIHHAKLKTDAHGKAVVSFTSPSAATGNDGDFEYTIEARVVDSSRREINGTGTLRVTRSPYSANLTTTHQIHRPEAKIELEIETKDPNEHPVSTPGVLRVYRERWTEVWLDTDKRPVSGKALADLRSERPIFPPAGWTLEKSGYESELVTTDTVTTGSDGKAQWSFRAGAAGNYRVHWSSPAEWGPDVTAETRVFVADANTRELGYLTGGVEILIDKDTITVGEEAVCLLSTAASNRWVLFTVESDALLHHEVVHLDGTVKLLRVPIEQQHVPNIWFGAVMVQGGRAHQDLEEIVVPPVDEFLNIEAHWSADGYEPGQKGAIDLRVTDRHGEPVRTELGVALVDDALSYIQGDMVPDPRQFFYGQRRWQNVRLQGSFQHYMFALWKRGKDGEWVDDVIVGGVYEKDGMLHGGKGRRAENRFADAEEDAVAAPMAQMEGLGYAGRSRADAPAARKALKKKEGSGTVEVRVREDFRKTALWLPDVVTDGEGRATIGVDFPDSTTRWKLKLRGFDTGSRCGFAESETRTSQAVIARLQAPRFFLQGDEVVLSGVINNNTEDDLELTVALRASGLEMVGLLVDGTLQSGSRTQRTIPAGSERRVDWLVRVGEPGSATLELTAAGDELGDAMKREFRIWPHGLQALVATAGKFRADQVQVGVHLPTARRKSDTELIVQVTPSLAVTMLDAMPYLVDYPYGCTEQTLSRFLPSVVVTRALESVGLSAETAMERVFGGVEREFVTHTQPKGKQNLAELDAMTAEGLDRLYDFQHGDGGWGWWKQGQSDRYMTAYVVWGLSLARDAGLDVRAGVLERGAEWLELHIVEEEQRADNQAWMLHAVTTHGQSLTKHSTRAFERLYAGRDELNAFSKALLCLSAVALGHEEEARVLSENLYNGVIRDDAPESSVVSGQKATHAGSLRTAHWGNDKGWRAWSEGGVETTAFVLRALLAVDAEHELVEPTVNWLVQNRRGAQWSNTRDTAITVLALNDYLVRSGELGSSCAYEVRVNGELIGERDLSAADVLSAPSEFAVPVRLLRDGENMVDIRRTRGDAPLYFAARASFFSLEEPIPARGNQLFLRREYYRLEGRPTLLKGTVFERVPLKDGDSIQSGERVEVVITLEAKNDLEYLVFEDLKPAGFEAVKVRSGEALAARQLKSVQANERLTSEEQEQLETRGAHLPVYAHGPAYTGHSRWLHQEFRDRHVAFFADKIGQGLWEIRYDLRAEVPGSFHALPVVGEAMYVPEIRANGEELRVRVLDRP